MSPSDEGLPPSQKVVVDGVTHVYYGPAQIQEGTAKFANDAAHNLEELHPPRSHVAVLHAGLKANEWQMGQSYEGLHAGIDLLKNGAASQKNKGNVAIVTLEAPILFAADRGEPVVQEKRGDHAVIARGTLLPQRFVRECSETEPPTPITRICTSCLATCSTVAL